jgi:hypothetical protein
MIEKPENNLEPIEVYRTLEGVLVPPAESYFNPDLFVKAFNQVVYTHMERVDLEIDDLSVDIFTTTLLASGMYLVQRPTMSDHVMYLIKNTSEGIEFFGSFDMTDPRAEAGFHQNIRVHELGYADRDLKEHGFDKEFGWYSAVTRD